MSKYVEMCLNKSKFATLRTVIDHYEKYRQES